MDYDVVNNILNVYVKSDMLVQADNPEVTLVEGLTSKGNATIAGKTVFTYHAADAKWTSFVDVTVELVESVEITGAESMAVGTTQKLTAKVLPKNATDRSVVWESANKAIATVDGEGNATAVKESKAVITARALDGSEVFDEFEIEVVKAAPDSNSLVWILIAIIAVVVVAGGTVLLIRKKKSH